ncbi:MAG: hypothetical protein ABEJ55_00475 [Halanaeroarchaeum sp.]
MTDYYDLVLGLIPFALLGIGGGLHFAGLALTTALTIGGLSAVGLVGHALFVNGPVSLQESRAEAASTAQTTSAPINSAE